MTIPQIPHKIPKAILELNHSLNVNRAYIKR
jgi:hypothetical protein